MSQVVVTTPNTHPELTTLEAVKTQLGITTGEQDGLLSGLILSASEFVKSWCHDTFVKEGVTEEVYVYDSPRLVVSKTPVINITEVRYDNSTIGSTEYFLENPEAGFIKSRRTNYWWSTRQPRQYLAWNITRHNWVSYSVDYTGGYIPPGSTEGPRTLPYDLEEAVIQIVKGWYFGADQNPNIRSQRTGDASETIIETRDGTIGIPPLALRLLERYRRNEP